MNKLILFIPLIGIFLIWFKTIKGQNTAIDDSDSILVMSAIFQAVSIIIIILVFIL